MAMERLLGLMAEKKASDLFIAAGTAVHIKINGTTVPVNQQRLDPASVEALLREVLTDKQWAAFEHENELNVGYGLRNVGSFRLSLFRQRGTTSAVIRYIPGDVPQFESLNLPPVLAELILEKRGLILVVGATGSGKTTTLASLLDHRNIHRSGHILTLEDPIEFTFRHKRSVVNQRQIGTDAATLQIALKNALRQAPDCLFIGEIRDVETMTASIAYAQSGHLVVATLHANNASHALNRIVSFYSPENRRVLLSDLATTLRAVVSQRLVRAAGGGRVPAVEILLNTTYVSELIEQARLSEIREAMDKSMAPGSQTFERALVDLVRAKRVSKEDALAQSDSPTNLLWLLDNTDDGAGAALSTPLPGRLEAPEASAPADRKPADGPTFSEFMLNI
ncbi:MAG: Twitching mobility protein [Pseudomonadota bacterium]|jgi:twitching motility protein PilU